MLEPPSASLLQVLRELRLCTPRDLRRCRGRVRRLTYDLPAFDSVWIDALVQQRQITPFQAAVLESNDPLRLKVGPCVLVDRLGGGPHGNTYLARPIGGRQLSALKLVEGDDEDLADALPRLQRLRQATSGWAHPSVTVPHAFERMDGRIVVVSRYVPGRNLAELLIRRGRYPSEVVRDIARQLLDGLIPLWARGQVHGDIRAANIRLTTAGVAVLVDTGVQPALTPELTPHANLPPDRYDSAAPERIGSGRAASAASDLYGLGCLLWQLLAGRPPFPGGDPLAKLADHQTKRIPDVRDWAPATPAPLAEAILRLTARAPDQRPQGAAELIRLFGRPRAAGRARLKKFISGFDAPMPATEARGSVLSRTALVLAGLFAVSGMVFGWQDRAAVRELWQTWKLPPSLMLSTAAADDHPAATSEPIVTADALNDPLAMPSRLPFPAPDPDGVVLLDTAGPYDAADLSFVGTLTVRGKEGVRPVVEIGTRPLSVWGTQVVLENLHLRAVAPETAPRALLLVQAQTLELRGCTFTAGSVTADSSTTRARTRGVAWKMIDPEDPAAGWLTVQDVVAITPGAFLYAAGPLQQITCRNVLKLGPGPAFDIVPAANSKLDLLIRLEAFTCRQTGSLVRCPFPPQSQARQRLTVEAEGCVFDLTEQAALFEIAGAELPPRWASQVQFSGEGSLAPDHLQIAGWRPQSTAAMQPLDPSEVELEGISAGKYTFRGHLSRDPAEAAIVHHEGPSRTSQPPGIDPATLPVP